jgi:hypothetical protein
VTQIAAWAFYVWLAGFGLDFFVMSMGCAPCEEDEPGDPLWQLLLLVAALSALWPLWLAAHAWDWWSSRTEAE